MAGRPHSSTSVLSKCHSVSHTTALTWRASLPGTATDVHVEVLTSSRWQKWVPGARGGCPFAPTDPDVPNSRFKCGAPHLKRNVAPVDMWRPAPKVAA